MVIFLVIPMAVGVAMGRTAERLSYKHAKDQNKRAL